VWYLARAAAAGRTDSLPSLAFALCEADAAPAAVLSDRTRRARAILASAAGQGAEGGLAAAQAVEARLAAAGAVPELPAQPAGAGPRRCDSLACTHTEADGPLQACGRCRRARYCSRDCQSNDWKLFGHPGPCKATPPP
jgi:hypothetical protein